MISIVDTPDLSYWRWVLRASYDGLITIFRTIGLTLIAISGIALAVPFTAWPFAAAGVCVLAAPEVIISATVRRISRMGFAQRQIDLSGDGVEVTAKDMRCFSRTSAHHRCRRGQAGLGGDGRRPALRVHPPQCCD